MKIEIESYKQEYLLTLEKFLIEERNKTLSLLNLYIKGNHYITGCVFGEYEKKQLFDSNVAINSLTQKIKDNLPIILHNQNIKNISVSLFGDDIYIEYFDEKKEATLGLKLNNKIKDKIFLLLPIITDTFENKLMDDVCSQPVNVLDYNVEFNEFIYCNNAVGIDDNQEDKFINKILKYF